ncbi:MAG: IS1182 family transposase [Chloroflexi bacterium]|nr:MAG: IS1182 family transposase [Chloroflexota bacterium]
MSLKSQGMEPVPEETARLAHIVCPAENLCLLMRDELGEVFQDELFASLFPRRGQPAEAPWRLAMVTVLQFAEGLTDRQAANAVRTRIDVKYALSLELEDLGFDFSVLSEFRARVLAGGAEHRLFEALLTHARTRGWLKARGRQRTDSTHVLAAIQSLSRLECVAETLRHALNVLATVEPMWLQAWVPSEWFERYATRWDDYRLPSGREERQGLAEMIGSDGRRLLQHIYAAPSPTWLRELPAITILRQVWIQQFYAEHEQAHWRDAKDLPPSSLLICTPYDAEARYSQKRGMSWTGYKVHVTESCDEDGPHLVTDVQTTPAPVSDFDMTPTIQAALGQRDLLPNEQLLDAGYVTAAHIISSQTDSGIDLVGPIAADNSWQAQAATGFGTADFRIEWSAQTAWCPQGCQSVLWMARQDRNGHEVIHIKFAAKECLGCPVRSQCTHALKEPRSIMIRAEPTYDVLQHARQRQQTPAFKKLYAKRAGIEGTLSQGVRAFGLRRSRYVGEAKTRLQMCMTAVAINVVRIGAWIEEQPRGQTRRSRFAALAPTG